MSATQPTVSRWMLAAMSCLSPFGVTAVAPLIPLLSINLNASAAELQYLISAYVLGLACTQPIAGFVSDHYGRRPVLLVGFALFIGVSALLTLPLPLPLMIALRFLQAVGVSVGTVVARGIVRDVLPPQEALKAFALISAAMGFSPIVSPIAAGLLATQFGVPSVFVLLSALGFSLWLWCFRTIPETRQRSAQPIAWSETLQAYGVLLTSTRFWGYAGAYGFLQGLFFSLLGIGALLFWEQFRIGINGFSLLWSSLAGVYIVGSFALNHFSYLARPATQMGVVWLLVSISILAPIVIAIWGLSLLSLLAPLSCMMFISGLLTPAVMLGAVNVNPDYSGTAAGLSSAIGMGTGAMFTVLGGKAYEISPFALVMVISISGMGVALSWYLARER